MVRTQQKKYVLNLLDIYEKEGTLLPDIRFECFNLHQNPYVLDLEESHELAFYNTPHFLASNYKLASFFLIMREEKNFHLYAVLTALFDIAYKASMNRIRRKQTVADWEMRVMEFKNEAKSEAKVEVDIEATNAEETKLEPARYPGLDAVGGDGDGFGQTLNVQVVLSEMASLKRGNTIRSDWNAQVGMSAIEHIGDKAAKVVVAQVRKIDQNFLRNKPFQVNPEGPEVFLRNRLLEEAALSLSDLMGTYIAILTSWVVAITYISKDSLFPSSNATQCSGGGLLQRDFSLRALEILLIRMPAELLLFRGGMGKLGIPYWKTIHTFDYFGR
ncbi:hypothetical protein HDU97_009991 [Phlyctochytrium planicorne]|nr:hypothetical protein HDU97_009991 [Phlyctochytrium planicorne]